MHILCFIVCGLLNFAVFVAETKNLDQVLVADLENQHFFHFFHTQKGGSKKGKKQKSKMVYRLGRRNLKLYKIQK